MDKTPIEPPGKRAAAGKGGAGIRTKQDGGSAGRPALARRERQILDIVFARGEATAAEIHAALPDPPSYSAVRAVLRTMEEKGHLKHRAEGKQYVFSATTPHRKAAKSALRRVLETFFAGSLEKAIVMHLTEPGTRISEQEAVRLMELIRQARERGT